MLPHIRSAVLDDVDQLIAIESEARVALEGRRGGDRWLAEHPSRSDRWTEIIGAGVVLVGSIDGVIVGYLVGYVDHAIATIEEIYVTPEARLVGFGDALLAGAVASFIEQHASVVEGTALPGDREMKNLYERAGIKARLITLSASLDTVRVAEADAATP